MRVRGLDHIRSLVVRRRGEERPFRRRRRSAFGAILRGAWALVLAAPLLPALPGNDDVPPAIRSFSRSLPRLFDEFQTVVAREKMHQETIDVRAARTLRRRVLVSDYQIARLDEDPDALWEFRFVREVDGKPVPGADRLIQDFFRLRHRDARQERLSIVDLARSQSLPGCYWHNLTLVLIAFTEPTVGYFRWRARGNRYEFEQVRGLGIPDDLFNPSSTRHYPKGALTLGGPDSSLSSLELRFPTGETEVVMTLTFAPQEVSASAVPSRYVVERKRASTGRTLFRTEIEYSNYRRFTVTTEEVLSPTGHLPSAQHGRAGLVRRAAGSLRGRSARPHSAASSSSSSRRAGRASGRSTP